MTPVAVVVVVAVIALVVKALRMRSWSTEQTRCTALPSRALSISDVTANDRNYSAALSTHKYTHALKLRQLSPLSLPTDYAHMHTHASVARCPSSS